jgi:phosphoglycerate kinase
MNLHKITDLDLRDKRVLLRLDLNLPVKDGKFIDSTRIIRSIPTLNYLLEQNAKIVIISHMGRPNGEFRRELSLAPVADELEQHLRVKVGFATDCFGIKVQNKIANMKGKEILLLENLRFNKGEEANSPEFAQQLSQLGEVFINDTFSCSHRKHASIDAIAKIMPSAAGFLLIEELRNIETFLKAPKMPLAAIVGGSKISTKINLLRSLVDKADYLILGGAMANTFLYAQGFEIGTSLKEERFVDQALEIIQLALDKAKILFLPQDFVVQNQLGQIFLRNITSISKDEAIMDLGPISSSAIAKLIKQAKALIWNGPVGAFEVSPYDVGSIEIARHIASATQNNKLESIVGGGDTIAVLKKSGLINSVSYTSTGGGAFLEWLEGKSLPGILALAK